MFSQVSVYSLAGRGGIHVTTTHDALGLTGTYPLLVTSGSHHWRHRYLHLSPSAPDMRHGYSTPISIYGWQVGGMHPTGMLSCYHPQRSWGKVLFSQASVILFTGGSASVHAGIAAPPRSRYAPAAEPPPPEQTPGSRNPPKQESPQNRHPLGAGNPLTTRAVTPPGTDTPREQAPPLSAQCKLRDTVNKRAVCILLECFLVWYLLSLHLKT